VTKDQRDLHTLAQENLRLCKNAEAAQLRRQEELTELLAAEESSKTSLESLEATLEAKAEGIKESQQFWASHTEAARECLGRLKQQALQEVMHRAEPKPTVACCKLARFVARVAWPDTEQTATEALGQDGALQLLCTWVTEEECASPLFTMEPPQRQAIGVLMRRAMSDMSDGQDSTKASTTAAPAAVPPPSDDPAQQLDDALRAWCRAVLTLSGWTSVNQYREDLKSLAELQEKVITMEAKAAEVAVSVITHEVSIKTNSDPYDPDVEPAAAAEQPAQAE